MKKRVLLFFFAILSSAFSSAAENNVIVKTGDILVFNKTSSATVTFDYGRTEVNDVPLAEFIEEKGEKEYKEDWERWIRDAERMFIEDFNKKSKGRQFRRSKKAGTDYYITVKVKTIETGNTAQGFLPTFSLKMKNGAPVMNGTLIVKDQEGANTCTLTLKNIYGLTGLTLSSRLTTLYMALSKKLRKEINRAVKEELKQQKILERGQREDEEEMYDEEEIEEDEEEKIEETDRKNRKIAPKITTRKKTKRMMMMKKMMMAKKKRNNIIPRECRIALKDVDATINSFYL